MKERLLMLKKTFILILLLFVFTYVFFILLRMIFILFRIDESFAALAPAGVFSALYVGRIYSHKYKMEIPQAHKRKIILYYCFIQLVLFMGLLLYMCEVNSLVKFITFSQAAVVPMYINLIVAICMYPALCLGCRMELTLEKTNLLNQQEQV